MDELTRRILAVVWVHVAAPPVLCGTSFVVACIAYAAAWLEDAKWCAWVKDRSRPPAHAVLFDCYRAVTMFGVFSTGVILVLWMMPEVAIVPPRLVYPIPVGVAMLFEAQLLTLVIFLTMRVQEGRGRHVWQRKRPQVN